MITITLKQFPLITVAFLLAICANLANAFEADAPFQALRQQQGARWNEEDREIDQRLQALRDKFGRRPNIIYILADDIGWGELGSYLGGKLRGTPTPNLDTMALQGILEAKNGQPRREVAKLDSQAMADFEAESAVRIVDFIKKNASGERPQNLEKQ